MPSIIGSTSYEEPSVVKVKGTKAGKPMKVITDAYGKTRVVVDQKKIEALKPVCARGKSKRMTFKRVAK